jgi:hypothetical protein
MVNLKDMSTKFFVTNTFRRVIVIVGCLLFVFSFIYPFYYVSSEFGGSGARTHYWSFEYDQYYSLDLIGSGSRHQWFFDYWFNPNLSVGPIMPWALISLFTVQVLTLVFGVVFIISSRRTLSFEPIMLSIAVLVLMTYTGEILSGYVRISLYPSQYQLGYYLVYPSVVLFVCAFALNEVVKKRQTASRDTSIPVKPQT